jgi:hypothetical protein
LHLAGQDLLEAKIPTVSMSVETEPEAVLPWMDNEFVEKLSKGLACLH